MSKHTLGPWKWTDRYIDSHGEETMSLIGVSGYGILSCDGMVNSPHGLGDYANAALIAAAPDLLEALEHLLNTCPAIDASGEEAHAKSSSAIAKAKGEQL